MEEWVISRWRPNLWRFWMHNTDIIWIFPTAPLKMSYRRESIPYTHAFSTVPSMGTIANEHFGVLHLHHVSSHLVMGGHSVPRLKLMALSFKMAWVLKAHLGIERGPVLSLCYLEVQHIEAVRPEGLKSLCIKTKGLLRPQFQNQLATLYTKLCFLALSCPNLRRPRLCILNKPNRSLSSLPASLCCLDTP